jgi:isoleucyl-tRNA synthetase
VHVDDAAVPAAMSADAWNELFIVSGHRFGTGAGPDDAFRLADVPGVAVSVALAQGTKCERCWKVLPDVGTDAAHPALCGRCASVVAA